ncbi:hypothetical protein [Streptomyces iakyrus]
MSTQGTRTHPGTGHLTIHQGADMGRPSTITVTVPADSGIGVTGTAVRI